MRTHVSIILFLIVTSLTSLPIVGKSQDIHFSQFFEAPLVRNPALAGLFKGDYRFQSIYRSQWASVTTPYITGSISGELKKHVGNGNDFITLGTQILYDKSGAAALTTNTILPAFNYQKSIDGERNKYISVGVMAGVTQRGFDRSKITTNNHFDGVGFNPALGDGETFANSNYIFFDGSAGISFSSSIGGREDDNYFIGLSYHHFNRPKNSFYKNPAIELSPRIVASGGVKFTLNETSYFTFHADYSKQGSYTEVIGGAIYSYKIGEDIDNPRYTLHMGGFMRVKDAFIPILKVDYHPFAFSFSYDANISQLRTASQGSGGIELTLSYTGFFDRDNSSRFVPLCPRF